MKFEAALAEMRKGKTVELDDWLFNLDIIREDGKIHLTLHDLLSDEWIIKEKPGKTFFPEVFEAFKAGKIVRRKAWTKDTVLTTRDNHGYSNVYLRPSELLENDWEICE